ncbi:MAG: AMIN domain-containing protein [Deltaproteobacteria bacterium]|nr:AMIN domain-containing protein [Deltaproteobacteria bacterium]
MNKYITTLVLGVVGVAMALVLGIHMRQVSGDGHNAPVAGGSSSNVNPGYAPPSVTTEEAPPPAASARLNLGQPSVPSSQASSSAPGIQPPAGLALTERQNADTETSPNPPGGPDQPALQGSAPPPATGPAAGGESAGRSSPLTPATPPARSVTTTPETTREATPNTPPRQNAVRPPSTSGQPSGTPQARPAQARSTASAASVAVGRGNILQTSLKFRGLGMFLSIEADSPLPVKYFVLSSPDRLVIDLPGAWKNLKLPAVPSNMLVKDIRIGRQADSDRIVIDLGRKIKNDSLIRLNDKAVEVFFE